MILLNPKKHNREYPDDEKSKEIMLKTIEFFEKKGLAKIKEDDHERVWYRDFLDFIKKEKIFSTLLTPSDYADEGDRDTRWDTWRNCEFNEILSFYGLAYWYTWQVTILGLGPIWMGKNEEVKKKTANLLKEGGIFAFGLSEKEHGADLYSSEMTLYPQESGTYLAKGSKYYIGNANEAALVSIFGKMSEGFGDPEDKTHGQDVYFAVNSQHEKYNLIKNVCNSQNYVAEFALNDYPITESDILTKGRDAWDSSLNTINVGKFNLGWASIGICTHAFYEALDHAANRRLFDSYVTDFVHIQQYFMDAYCRLVAMKLFALRAADYMRSASPTDRRYLLYNPIVKMKVTTQGEEVIDLLWDIIAAKGFETDVYFSMAARDIRALPKLEGTVHVNMALIIKFILNYFLNPGKFPEIPMRNDANNDDFLFNQGETKGLSKIQFHDYNTIYNSVDLPNVNIFKEQIEIYKEFVQKATPTPKQGRDFHFLYIGGQLFTIVPYGQLIIENAKKYNIDDDLLDQIFDFMIRDFSKYALQMYSSP
ncbi:MAG: acyl-CoA dehydrogenase, partial [Candidatus Helarchaeota archaeon]|nr:acyl-CoA dehydrogenase [Candidatus Helarchaeota archaeon]